MSVLRRLNILSWPIWGKLLLGFAVAVLIPVILVVAIGINNINRVSLENLEFYVSEIGSRQRDAVSENLNQAMDQFQEFLRLTRSSLWPALRDETPSRLAGIESQIQRTLINTVDSFFKEAGMVTLDGRILVGSAAQRLFDHDAPILHLVSGEVLSGSILTDIRNLEAYQLTDDFIVYVQDGKPGVDLVSLIYDSTDPNTKQVAGYMVATLDLDRAVLGNVAFQNETQPIRSYLVHRSGKVIALPDVMPQAPTISQLAIVQRALEKVRGVDIYDIKTGEDVQQAVGYYAPLSIPGYEDPPFVLVTEIDRGIVENRWIDDLRASSFPIILGLVTLTGILIILFYQIIVPPLAQLVRAIRLMGAGNYEAAVPAIKRKDEIGEVATAFVNMRQQMVDLIQDFSDRMAKRARDISTAQEISRIATSERDLQSLMNQVVNLIVERFDTIYHAQIFLIDADQRYAVLQASTGEAGEKLLARGHRLPVGGTSVIGRVMEQQRVILDQDTAHSKVHQYNEILPETRSELAIPLHVGTQVVGALDVQSKQRDSFTDDHITVLQTLADQIAITIRNAQLHQQSLARLREIETTNRSATRQAWESYMMAQRLEHLSGDYGTPTDLDTSDLQRTAISTGEVVIGERTAHHTIPLAIPIKLRGQALGTVEWELPESDFGDDTVLLAQELVNRLAVSLDNARLFQQSQEAIERERLVNEIATKLALQPSIDDILQTAIQEVGQALRAPQVAIRFNWGNENNAHDSNGHTSDPAEQG